MTSHEIKYVYWELSNYCNLHCKHCFAHATNSKETIVQREQLFSTIDSLHQHYPIAAIRFGGGEPFLVDYFFELIRFCTERGIAVDVTTNGLLLTPSLIEELSHTGLREITVSIDGLEATHDYIRGKNTFCRSKEVIRQLLNHNEFSVSVSFTVTRINYSEIREFVEEFSNIGVKKFYFFRYCGDNNRDILSLKLNHLLSASSDIEYLLSHHEDIKIMHEPCSFYIFSQKDNVRTEGCNFANGIISINYKGDIVVCAAIDKIIGNIFGEEINQLYNKIIAEQSLIKSIPTECGQCQFRVMCHGGCKAESYSRLHDYSAKDPLCLKCF